jgi:hypothetical protein
MFSLVFFSAKIIYHPDAESLPYYFCLFSFTTYLFLFVNAPVMAFFNDPGVFKSRFGVPRKRCRRDRFDDVADRLAVDVLVMSRSGVLSCVVS